MTERVSTDGIVIDEDGTLAANSDDRYATQKAVKTYVDSFGSGDVYGPGVATDGHLAVFDGPSGKLLKDGGAVPSGGLASVYNVKDHGLAGDGSTDDTEALQALIDLVTTNGGGTIYFPDEGPYIIAGALQDGSRINSQLILPSVAAGDPQLSIAFEGFIAPNFVPWPGSEMGLPRATIIKSTLSSVSGTQPSVISGRGPVSGLGGDLSFLRVSFKNMILQAPANPAFSFLNLSYISVPMLEDVLVLAGDRIDSLGATEPTHDTSYGILFAEDGKSVMVDLRGQVNVWGFYNGLRWGELVAAKQIGVWMCKVGMQIPFSNHASLIERFLQWWTPTGMKFNGAHPIQVFQWDTENAADGSWYSPLYHIDDPTNYGRGEVTWWTVLAAVGPVDNFSKNGGGGIMVKRIGAVTVPPSLLSAEIGLVDASTVAVTFSESVKASSDDFVSGVTIKVNDVTATISSATRQSSHDLVYYVLSSPVTATDIVAFNYKEASGFITNFDGVFLQDSGLSVENNVTGTTVLLDHFTDSDGTILPLHTMDTGPGWTKWLGGSSEIMVISNKAQTVPDTGDNSHSYFSDSGEADVLIQAKVNFRVWGDNGSSAGFIARFTDSNNYYAFSLANTNSPNNMVLYKIEGGVQTTTSATVVLLSGVDYSFIVRCVGNDIQFLVEGTMISITNAFNNSVTKHGITATNNSATGHVTFDDFKVVA